MRATKARRGQAGVFLIEALIGLLIFMVGALAMIALQANGVAAQTDAQYRIEAANLADQILGEITVGTDRTTAATLQADLARYAYNTTTAANCTYSGGANAAAPASIAKWNSDVTAKLPTSSASMRQILLNTANSNQVTVTICWQTSSDAAPRRHSVVAFIN